MKINEIFCSVNGESSRAGLRTVFIRTFGCMAPFCSYCDTRYAIEGNDFKEMSVEDIMREVRTFCCNRVTYTGGEPLLQHDALELIRALVDENYQVEIETNGAVDISPYVRFDLPDLLITMDWKCPSSGMNKLMLKENLAYLRPTDVIKFVVGNKEDLLEMERISGLTLAETYVSPVFGMIEPKEIAEYIIENQLNYTRLQIQQHKIIFDPMARGV